MRVGNNVDLKKIWPAGIDGQADAVEGNRTLGNNLGPVFFGKGKAAAQRLARARNAAHCGKAVHMTAHQMPAKTVTHGQCPFHIDHIATLEFAKGCARKGFCRGIGRKHALAVGFYRQAGSVNGNGFAIHNGGQAEQGPQGKPAFRAAVAQRVDQRFGNAAQAEAAGARVDALDAKITWKHIENAQGCNVRYGVAPDKLYLSWLVYDADEVTLSTLTAGQEYYICVDSFNENGITPGKTFKLEG